MNCFLWIVARDMRVWLAGTGTAMMLAAPFIPSEQAEQLCDLAVTSRAVWCGANIENRFADPGACMPWH
jgi:hypothetical protein